MVKRKLAIYDTRTIARVTSHLIDAGNKLEVYDLDGVRHALHEAMGLLAEETVGEPPDDLHEFIQREDFPCF